MKILILDDDPSVGSYLKEYLESNFPDGSCYVCTSIEEFKRLNKEINPDYYVMDVVLLNGQVFSVVDQFDPSRAILVTGYATDRVGRVAETCGFHGVLPKPLTGDVLKGMLDSLRLKASLDSSTREEMSRLFGVFPQLFDILARNLIDGEKVQKCVELIGRTLNSNVVVSPFESQGEISFPLFGYFKEEESQWVEKKTQLPQLWFERLKKGEIVAHVATDDSYSFLNLLSDKARRALAVPITGEEIGNWGFMLVFDEKDRAFSKEEIEFIKSLSSVLALALLRLKHNTTLEHVLREAISSISTA